MNLHQALQYLIENPPTMAKDIRTIENQSIRLNINLGICHNLAQLANKFGFFDTSGRAYHFVSIQSCGWPHCSNIPTFPVPQPLSLYEGWRWKDQQLALRIDLMRYLQTRI